MKLFKYIAILLCFLFLKIETVFAFQQPIISTNKEYLKVVLPLKKKFFQHHISKIDNPQKIRQQIDACYNWGLKNENVSQQIIAKILLARFFESQKNEIEVIVLVNELLKNEHFLKEKHAYFALKSLRFAYKKTEQYNLLLELYDVYYKHLTAFKIPSRNSSKLRRIANAHYRLQNYKVALKYFKESEAGWLKEENYYLQSGANNDMGLCFLNMNQLDSAKYYFNKSLEILEKEPTEKIYFEKIVKANLASILVKKKQYKKALPFLLTEIKNSKGIETSTTVKGYYKIANVYYLTNKSGMALKYIDSALNSYPNYHDKKLKQKTLFLKAKALLKAGKIKQADKAFEISNNFNDSIRKEELSKNYLLATVKHETKKRELELLESKQKIALDKVTKNYQKLGLFILALALIGVFFVLRKLIKDKKRITNQKLKAEKISKEKEVLLKEVHHRVKNNLQVISSILELQSLKHNNDELTKSLQVGQNRIQTMSLIHQQLYKSDNIKEINFKEYVQTLITYIKAVNAEVICSVQFNLSLDTYTFPVTTATPLGLIVNELITNSYKHAFVDRLEGVIDVKLVKNKEHSFTLTVADNGIGLTQKIEKANSLGLKLVQILSKQLEGEMNYSVGNGTRFTINFKDNIAV